MFFFYQVEGVATEVINATVYYREKWAIVMLDMSAACTISESYIYIFFYIAYM